MRFFGKLIKTLLRSLFSIIIFILLVGLAKMNRDINSYISFLNDNDRSSFHRSQPTTWSDPFRENNQISGNIADILGETPDPELSGLDVYDPAFEQDLNEFSDPSLSGTTEGDFGFTTSVQASTDTHNSSDTESKTQLLNLIKQRELAK